MDAGGRAKQEARAEGVSLRVVKLDRSVGSDTKPAFLKNHGIMPPEQLNN